eukprot:379272_1
MMERKNQEIEVQTWINNVAQKFNLSTQDVNSIQQHAHQSVIEKSFAGYDFTIAFAQYKLRVDDKLTQERSHNQNINDCYKWQYDAAIQQKSEINNGSALQEIYNLIGGRNISDNLKRWISSKAQLSPNVTNHYPVHHHHKTYKIGTVLEQNINGNQQVHGQTITNQFVQNQRIEKQFVNFVFKTLYFTEHKHIYCADKKCKNNKNNFKITTNVTNKTGWYTIWIKLFKDHGKLHPGGRFDFPCAEDGCDEMFSWPDDVRSVGAEDPIYKFKIPHATPSKQVPRFKIHLLVHEIKNDNDDDDDATMSTD